MLKCNRKIFNTFLFLSIIFLAFSFFCNTVVVSATAKKTKKQNTSIQQQIQVQQETILDCLENIETKIERRRGNE